MNDKARTKMSKHLSLVLRHDPASVGITLDSAGWAKVTELLAAMKITGEQLREIVATNNKKRFELSPDGSLIRASQGHSIDVDLGYSPSEPPITLYHGTSEDTLPAIYKDGLLKMNRHHVHLSADRDTALKVAQRRPKPVILKVNAQAMARKGLQFYLSTNGVWLTDAVPPKYLSR